LNKLTYIQVYKEFKFVQLTKNNIHLDSLVTQFESKSTSNLV